MTSEMESLSNVVASSMESMVACSLLGFSIAPEATRRMEFFGSAHEKGVALSGNFYSEGSEGWFELPTCNLGGNGPRSARLAVPPKRIDLHAGPLELASGDQPSVIVEVRGGCRAAWWSRK